MTTALRSFLRYARYRGEITLDLAAAVPVVANWSMTSIPRAIAPDQVRQLLASIDRRTAVGRRDYAILLLLARLGLRSGEVAFLELDDIDWNAGQLSVRGKSGQRNELPLPAEVGKAIAAYLRQWTTAQHQSPRISCAPEPRSAAFEGPAALDRSFDIRSSAPASMPPPREHISFAMDWPPRCCARAPRSARSASCWVIAIHRPRRSTPRSISRHCARSRCRGREVCDEHASTGRSRVPEHAAQIWDSSCRRRARGCSISSRSWSSTAPPTSLRRWRSPGLNNRRTFNPRIGRDD